MNDTPKTLTTEDSDKLLTQLIGEPLTLKQEKKCSRNFTIAILMLDAGLRVGEVVQLRGSDLYFNTDPVTSLIVRAEIAKNKTERIIPVSIRLTAALVVMFRRLDYQRANYLPGCTSNSSEPFFPITTRQVERIIKNAALNCLGRPIHPHILRHTFASRLMRTTNARVVQELLGHKNLTSTQIYTHPNHDDLKKAIDGIVSTVIFPDENSTSPDSPSGGSNCPDATGANRDMR